MATYIILYICGVIASSAMFAIHMFIISPGIYSALTLVKYLLVTVTPIANMVVPLIFSIIHLPDLINKLPSFNTETKKFISASNSVRVSRFTRRRSIFQVILGGVLRRT